MNPIVQERVMGMQSERITGSFTQDSVALTKCAPTIPFKQHRKQCSLLKTPTRQTETTCLACSPQTTRESVVVQWYICLWTCTQLASLSPCQVALWSRLFNPLLILAALRYFPSNQDKYISKGRRRTSSPGITQLASIIHQNGKAQHTGETTSALVKKPRLLKDSFSQKSQNLSFVLTLIMSFQTHMTFFLLQNTKKYILSKVSVFIYIELQFCIWNSSLE